MLRVLAIWMLLAAVPCVHAVDSRFVGYWRGYGTDEKVLVRFASDGTFRMATLGWTTPPVLDERGRWRVRRARLMLRFRSQYRPGRLAHVVLPIISVAPDKILLRTADRKGTVTLQRVYDPKRI